MGKRRRKKVKRNSLRSRMQLKMDEKLIKKLRGWKYISVINEDSEVFRSISGQYD